eukprot:m.336798 g.336798  ORF g.336798 m.336798 type:complete len:303 (-) comp17964_c0_seq1:2076-2984(-)
MSAAPSGEPQVITITPGQTPARNARHRAQTADPRPIHVAPQPRGRAATTGQPAGTIRIVQPEATFNLQASLDYVDTLTYHTVREWTVDDVCQKFLLPIGMGKLQPIFSYHKISGNVLSRLEKEDLKDMQVLSVGDRVFLSTMLKELRLSYKRHLREEIVWNGMVPPPKGGLQYFPDVRTCLSYKCCPCCSPSYLYEFSRQGLRVKTIPPACVVCCSSTESNFYDIRFMKDLDWETELMCCGLLTKKQMSFLFLEDGQAQYGVEAISEIKSSRVAVAHPDISEELVNKIAFVWSETRLVAGAV